MVKNIYRGRISTKGCQQSQKKLLGQFSWKKSERLSFGKYLTCVGFVVSVWKRTHIDGWGGGFFFRRVRPHGADSQLGAEKSLWQAIFRLYRCNWCWFDNMSMYQKQQGTPQMLDCDRVRAGRDSGSQDQVKTYITDRLDSESRPRWAV